MTYLYMRAPATHIGDVFEIPISDSFKRYMQFVVVDSCQLGGWGIRVFKKDYPLDCNPAIDDILNGEIDFFCLTRAIGHGVLDGLWTKVGKSKDLGDLDKMVFRTYVERVPGILASHWFVWKANHNLKEYKTLPRRYRKVDYGGVMPPSHVVERIRTGRWFKVQNVYDDYDSYLTKWGCERISVPFLRQQRKD